MNSIEPKSEAAILAEKEGEAVQLYQICRLRAMPAAPAGSPVPCDGSSRAPGAAHRPAEWRGWPRSGRRGAATAQEPAALRPAKLHLEVPAAEEGWVDSAWTGARGCRGMQIGPRRVLGTLPQPVFRQPDVTRLHGSDARSICKKRQVHDAIQLLPVFPRETSIWVGGNLRYYAHPMIGRVKVLYDLIQCQHLF